MVSVMNRNIKNLRNRACAAALAALAFSAPFMAFPTVAQAQAQATTSERQAIDEAVAALRGISTMKADFEQSDRSGQSVRGTLTLKRPGKIRFQYAPGVPMLIVADGSSLTLIDYEVRQVQRWPIRNSPLGALLDPSRDVARYARLLPVSNNGARVIEVRDPAHPEYGVITLAFVRRAGAPGGFELMSWVALDSQNKRTTIRLSNQRYGMAVADSEFRWTDPRRSPQR